jgi:hypothetical protein
MKKKMVLNLASAHCKLHRDSSQALRMNLAAADDQLHDLTALFRKILSDDNFLTLLRSEGLTSIPTCLIGRLR